MQARQESPSESRLPTTEPIQIFEHIGNLSLGTGIGEQAYQLVRDAILDGRLAPGTRLPVPEIARQLGISRSPAREAIARVAAEGLAVVEPRRGAVVARISPESLRDIYEVREVLEGLACRLAAERATAAELEELRVIVAEHRIAVNDGDVAVHMELDQRFHGKVRQAARNPPLVEALDRLQSQIRIAMNTTLRSPGGMAAAHAEHEQIAAALLRRDRQASETAGRHHVQRLKAELGEVPEPRRSVQ